MPSVGWAIDAELDGLFDFFKKKHITYCVLQSEVEFNLIKKSRGYSDIDLFVSKTGFKDLEEYLYSNKWFLEDSYRFKGIRKYFAKYIKGFKLKLDVSSVYAVFTQNKYFECSVGLPIANGDELRFLSNEVSYYFIVKKIYETKVMKPEKLKILILLAELMHVKVVSERELKSHSVDVDKYFNKPSKGRVSFTKLLIQYSKQLLPSKGKLCIAFIGMDGSGKGTYIKLINNELINNNFNLKNVYLGHSGYMHPIIKAIVQFKEKGVNNKALKKLNNILYLIVFPFELIFRRGRGQCDILITDRHPNFENVFPANSMFSLYDKWLTYIAPTPNIVFFLNGNKEELWQRKKEMSFDDYMKKSNILDELVEKNIRNDVIINIDTTNSINVVGKEIFDEIASFI